MFTFKHEMSCLLKMTVSVSYYLAGLGQISSSFENIKNALQARCDEKFY